MARPPRGSVLVGKIADLDAVEAGAVLYLRLWCEGPAAQETVLGDFTTALGPDAGRQALQSFDELCALCLRHGRRPLMRHHVACQCLGADEACFANFIAAAAEGDREDAILIATLLVRSDLAMCLVGHAATFGLALKRLALRHAAQVPATAARSVH